MVSKQCRENYYWHRSWITRNKRKSLKEGDAQVLFIASVLKMI